MEFENSPPTASLVKCCDCGCSCSMMNRSLSGTYIRSVKRKYDEFEEESEFTIPGFVLQQNARVEIENECQALREMVSTQQETIEELVLELDEERNAAASAANEAMSMILRLQREKAEVQMEARQFKRFAEEKIAHDQQELLALEDLLYKREQTIQSLTCEVQAYRHRMMSYGLAEAEVDGQRGMSRINSMAEIEDGQFSPREIYPPLRCNLNEAHPDGDDDVEKYAFGESPRSRDHLRDLEQRINQLEKTHRAIQPEGDFTLVKNVFEKVIVGQSPTQSTHFRKSSNESSNSFSKEVGPDSPRYGSSFKKTESSKMEENIKVRNEDSGSEAGDDASDRVYTIDAVHPKPSAGIGDDCVPAAKESVSYSDGRDLEIQKLYARLHALEADRESMRQAIISVGTDKAQLVLLKEIAQNLCKEMSPARRMPVRKSAVGSYSFISVFKWIVSFLFWRRKARRPKYMFGASASNPGLLMLLDRGSCVAQWRGLMNTKS